MTEKYLEDFQIGISWNTIRAPETFLEGEELAATVGTQQSTILDYFLFFVKQFAEKILKRVEKEYIPPSSVHGRGGACSDVPEKGSSLFSFNPIFQWHEHSDQHCSISLDHQTRFGWWTAHQSPARAGLTWPTVTKLCRRTKNVIYTNQRTFLTSNIERYLSSGKKSTPCCLTPWYQNLCCRRVFSIITMPYKNDD